MNRARAGAFCLAWLLVGSVAAAMPERERFDPKASTASIVVGLWLPTSLKGRFETIEGELQPAAKGQWRVQARLDARALVLDGPAWMVRATRSEKFLDVVRYPEISFVSEPFAPTLLAAGGDLTGKLRLRGRTRPVSFTLAPSSCEHPGRDCEILVSGGVDRRDFGMTSHRLWVRDTVEFEFRVRLLETD
jgi:polyisoprenoid-binding protein YceI